MSSAQLMSMNALLVLQEGRHVFDFYDKLMTNNTQQNQYNQMCCPDSQQCLMFTFDVWEEADYLYLCTVVEVIVLPPFLQN